MSIESPPRDSIKTFGYCNVSVCQTDSGGCTRYPQCPFKPYCVYDACGPTTCVLTEWEWASAGGRGISTFPRLVFLGLIDAHPWRDDRAAHTMANIREGSHFELPLSEHYIVPHSIQSNIALVPCMLAKRCPNSDALRCCVLLLSPHRHLRSGVVTWQASLDWPRFLAGVSRALR